MKRYIGFALLGLLLISGAYAIVGTEFGQEYIRGDNTLYKADVSQTSFIDDTFNSKNYTQAQFNAINVETYNFKTTHNQKYIFDKKDGIIYFIWTYVTTQENQDGEGFQPIKKEVLIPMSYKRWESCRETETKEKCRLQGVKYTEDKLNSMLESEKKSLIGMQTNQINDEVFDDF